ncbi:Small ribosomal subunit protein eS27y-like protein, partial [Drosera capensis]
PTRTQFKDQRPASNQPKSDGSHPHSSSYITLSNINPSTLLLLRCPSPKHAPSFISVAAQPPRSTVMVLQNDIDLLNPPAELEKRKHKLKRLVQSPNSFFMDVKCQGCFNITTVFSHSQTVVVCGNCQTVLCQPTGGRARLTEGCSFRKKGD